MKWRRMALLGAAAMGVTAQAEGRVAGTWVGGTQGPGGRGTVTLVLSVEGNVLTGTFGRGNRETEITRGSVEDGAVSFQVAVGRRGAGLSMSYTGQVVGDTLTLTPSFAGGPAGRSGPRRGRDPGPWGTPPPLKLIRQEGPGAAMGGGSTHRCRIRGTAGVESPRRRPEERPRFPVIERPAGRISFRMDDPVSSLPSPFPVFGSWTRFERTSTTTDDYASLLLPAYGTPDDRL